MSAVWSRNYHARDMLRYGPRVLVCLVAVLLAVCVCAPTCHQETTYIRSLYIGLVARVCHTLLL